MTGPLHQLTASLADRYVLERELGQGGMATVYLARDLKHEREVAIKILRADLSASLGAGRFLREIKIAAQLQHPHILPLLDSGTTSPSHPEQSEGPLGERAGQLYFVMPYIKGQSLRERLGREGELPVHEAVRLISEVVDALVEAHAHGVVHRDIKPDNVMLSGRHALVTDFGVAKAISEATGRNTITTLGVAVGTPTYMSPEQAAADPHVDHRSDIYSVGVMLYEMLSGRAPFVGSTPQQVLAAHVTEAPDPVSKRRPAIPAALEQVVMRCLAKRPADRFQTSAELHAALEPLATPSTGITPVQTQPVERAPRSNKRIKIAIGAVALIAATIGVWLVSGRTTHSAAQPALDPVRLTTNGRASAPALSPDGREVAYVEQVCPSDSTPCTGRLMIQDIATGSRQPISGDADVDAPRGWTSSGAWILVQMAIGGRRAERYVISHLGGAAMRVGVPAVPMPFGDTILSGRTAEMGSSPTTSLQFWVAPWNQPVDSVNVAVPPGAIFLSALAVSPNGRWIAAVWDSVGQTIALLTIVDRTGRQLAERTIPYESSVQWNATGTALYRPIQSSDHGALERIRIDRRAVFGAIDTVLLSPSDSPPDVSRSADGMVATYSETHLGEASLMAIEAANGRELPRIARRMTKDAALWSAIITPDGGTVLYTMASVSGREQAVQFFRMPYRGGDGVAVTPPLKNVVDFCIDADSRHLIVVAQDASRSRATAFDILTGNVAATAERPDTITGLAVLSGGELGFVLRKAVEFVDASLRRTAVVAVPDTLGRANMPVRGVGPDVALMVQQLDFTRVLGTDGNFHVALLHVSQSGGVALKDTVVARMYWQPWWEDDGAVVFPASSMADPKQALYRVVPAGSRQERLGRIPFRDWVTISLAADGRRGVAVLRPGLRDIWLLRNFTPMIR